MISQSWTTGVEYRIYNIKIKIIKEISKESYKWVGISKCRNHKIYLLLVRYHCLDVTLDVAGVLNNDVKSDLQ